MSATPAHHRFAVDDYERLHEAGILDRNVRVELIHGEILTKMTIGDRHAAAVNRLTALLIRLLGDQANLSIQNPIRLADSIPEPDLALLRPRDDFYASGKPTAGEILLVIEVSDPALDFDRRVKLPLYASSRIQEFWILNLVDERLEIYRDPWPDGTYSSIRSLNREDQVHPLAFPELALAIHQMF